ncbi:MAG: hypothetical protein HZA92_14340 [Verrucomicrobia bacterium]|nr:hypothetical protein [Verrucomicrobiota bacterium]
MFDRLNQYAAMRLQRWLWRKGGCRKSLHRNHPRGVLRERHGPYQLLTSEAWKQAVAQKREQ